VEAGCGESAVLKQLTGTLILAVMYLLGEGAARLLDVGIPGSVFGLVVCAASMFVAPPLRDQLRPGGSVFLTLIPLFLVPVLSRMALSLDFTTSTTWMVVAATAVATLVGLVLTSLIVKLVFGAGRP
jgi:putative effector of murein hydrolase LrgA (UPF0299 family)